MVPHGCGFDHEVALHVTRTDARAPRRGTLIAVHGMMESGPTLRSATAAWAASGWDVLAPDLRGHGRSARWDTQDNLHPGDRLVHDIVTLVDGVLAADDADPLVIFGHSAGGGVAAAVAAERSAHVRAVVLEDPFWRLPVTRRQDRDVARQAYTELLDRQALSLPDLMEHGHAVHPSWASGELPAWAQAQYDADPALVLDGDVIPSPPWPGLLSDLRAVGIPVLVVTGTAAPGVGMTDQHRVLLAEQGARLAVVPGASHFVRRDEPEEFNRLTLAFLADAERSDPTHRHDRTGTANPGATTRPHSRGYSAD